jgi:hypothetical protein
VLIQLCPSLAATVLLLAVSVSTELNAACSVIVNLADQMDRTMLYWLQMFFLLVYERCVFCNTMFKQAVSSVVIIQEYEQDRVGKSVIFS